MITITGQLQDATGAPLHATIDFVSKSTPLAASGVVTTNTDATIKSNPADGTFSITLAAGNYQVTITAAGQASSFNIAVPGGTATAAIDTLVTSSLSYNYLAPNVVWNGFWAGNITFQPIAAPAAPTHAEVSYAGGNIDSGANHYTYWISYVTATGQTAVSPALFVTYSGGSNHPNQATRIYLNPNQPGVTGVNLWRTFIDAGHNYDTSGFPVNVGLLAGVSPAAAYYDDWESTAQFAARVTTAVPPLYNTSAGQLLSSNGTVCAYITDNGLFFPGANCRVKPGVGLQLYNFTTSKWHTLLVTGNPAQLGLDSGNPN